MFAFASGEGSAETLSGLAKTLHALYSKIGGCISYILFFMLVLPYFFLYFVFLLDRARCHFKKVDFNKLLRHNLELNCVVSPLAFVVFALSALVFSILLIVHYF